MKKIVKGIVYVVLSLMLTVPCAAYGIDEGVEITEYPSPYTIRVTDENNNPVPNIELMVLSPDVARPYYDYSSEVTAGYTDLNGQATLCLAGDGLPLSVIMYDGKEKVCDYYRMNELPEKDGIKQIVWEHDFPSELGKKTDSGLQIRVVDKDGKAVPGIEISAKSKEQLLYAGDDYEPYNIFGGYTENDGCYYNSQERDGSELKLTLTQKLDGKKIIKRYTVSPEAGKKNRYKMIW